MTNKFVQPGLVLDYTPAGAITNGQVVLIGLRIGVALTAIAAGATGPLQVSGVFTIDKAVVDVIAVGALLYWDNAASKLTTVPTANTLAGFAVAAAGNGATTVNVKINA